MTLKDFSRSYGVPYHVVYESSYKVTPTATLIRERDYNEHDLYCAVRELLRERIDRHNELMEANSTALKNMERTKVQNAGLKGN